LFANLVIEGAVTFCLQLFNCNSTRRSEGTFLCISPDSLPTKSPDGTKKKIKIITTIFCEQTSWSYK